MLHNFLGSINFEKNQSCSTRLVLFSQKDFNILSYRRTFILLSNGAIYRLTMTLLGQEGLCNPRRTLVNFVPSMVHSPVPSELSRLKDLQERIATLIHSLTCAPWTTKLEDTDLLWIAIPPPSNLPSPIKLDYQLAKARREALSSRRFTLVALMVMLKRRACAAAARVAGSTLRRVFAATNLMLSNKAF